MSQLPKKSWLSRNLVVVVMVPTIIGFHYGWHLMQSNRTLVSESEQIDLPPVTFAKFVWRRLQGLQTGTGESNSTTPSVGVESHPR